MERISRLFEAPSQSFFLFGPRGTGKSTLIKALFAEASYIDLLLPDVFRNYKARPERFIDYVHGNETKKIFILDEVQKVPELLDVVHSLIEEKKGWLFVLTGSSARKLKKVGVDLLAGRALIKHLHPFLAAELKELFTLDSALKNGLLPVVLNSPDPAASLQAYIDLYIREKVQMEGLTRNIGDFSRFLEAISFSHGSVLNTSNVARECQVDRKVVNSYIGILEDLLLAFRIPVFAHRAKRVLANHPKFYFFDAGVFQALRPFEPLDRQEERHGPALEELVVQHLRAWIDYSNLKAKLFFLADNFRE
ncbi:ATP-binding protein [Candidatus Saganbacteria bacterium]|nr:ATP-binding protein [Candidatus Saganbacteria bacterium]